MADRRPALGVIAFAHLCELLNSMAPNSKEWFRERCGIGKRTTDKFFKTLRNRKLIYVSYWSTGGKRVSTRIAMWTWGYNRPDAPRPKPVPKAIIDRASRLRRKAFSHAKQQ